MVRNGNPEIDRSECHEGKPSLAPQGNGQRYQGQGKKPDAIVTAIQDIAGLEKLPLALSIRS